MPTITATERVALLYRQGSSDKVYHAAIEPAAGTEDRFLVTFAFGRRGGTLSSGTKTPSPVPFDDARKIYDRLVKEKTAKGYTPGEDGTPFAGTEKAGRATCVLPQLLNPVEEAEIGRLIADAEWWAQPKFDGRRTMILKEGSAVTGINRTGLTIALPAPIAEAALRLSTTRCLLDGELVGNVYHCFDALGVGDDDLRDETYARRYDAALNLIDTAATNVLRYAETATTAAAKRKLVDRLRREKAEGVVFKHRLAPYTHGRPHVGGPQLKLKFWASASCMVARPNAGKRSVELELFDGDRLVRVGSVTIPANQPMPPTGSVAEVRYLYAYPGGSLYQPVFLGRRDDIAAAECQMSHLKFKVIEGDAASGSVH